MDRTPGCGPGGWRFDSSRARSVKLEFGGVQEWFIWPVSKTERVARFTEVRILSPPLPNIINPAGKVEKELLSHHLLLQLL